MTTSSAADEGIAGREPLRPSTMRFGRLLIDFDARVLQPRPWTTNQSRWAAKLLRSVPDGPVLELCAGAGQIGLLGLADQDRELVLVDVDETACAYARFNATRAGLADRVSVRCAAVTEALEPHERFALVIADPPWVPSADVQRYPGDPVHAIDGGADGLGMAWVCLDVIADHLLAGGCALVQLGSADQAAALGHRLDQMPASGLTVTDVRRFDPHGALVLVQRRDQRETSPTVSPAPE